MRRATLQLVRIRQAISAAIICCLCVSQSIADDAPKRPFIVGSVRSLDAVRDNIQQVFDSAGSPEKARTLEALALLATAGRGADGIDKTRPCGFAFDVDVANNEAETATWYFLPVSNKDSFVRLISVFAPKLEQRKPGLYRFGPESDYRMKLTDRWAFFYAASKTDPVFPDPSDIIGEDANTYDAAISVNLSVIPRELMEEFTDLKGQQPDGEPNIFVQLLSQIYRDGEELVIGYRASGKDAKANTVVDFEFKPRSGTQSATWLANSARTPNRFARLVDDNALVSTKVSLPVNLIRSAIASNAANGSLAALLEQQIRSALDSNDKLNAKWKQALQKLVKANSSLKQFDCALSIGGGARPSVFAHQLAEAKQLEQLLTEMIKQRADDFKEVVTPNAATHKGQNIHTVSWRSTDDDKNVRQLIGDEGKLHITFLEDAVIYTAGPKGLQRMKSAIDTLGSPAKPANTETPTSPFELELALGQILTLAADDDEFVKMAVKNFKTDDRLRVAIELLRDRSRMRLEFGEAYPRFLGKAYAMAYEDYVMAGTLNQIAVDDLGLGMLGLLASVPFGFVHFDSAEAPDCMVPFRVYGGVVDGQAIGQPAQFYPAANPYQSATSPYQSVPIGTTPSVSYGPGVSVSRSVTQATQQVVQHSKEDLPVLLEGLKYRDPQVRIKSAQMIGQLGKDAKSAVPALIELLKQTDGNSRVIASPYQSTSEPHLIAQAIAKIGTDAVPGLTKAIASEKQHVVNAASSSLQSIEKIDAATPTLIKILKDEKAEVWRKQTALVLIGTIGKPASAAIPVVTKMLKSDAWKDRRALIDCIQKIGDPPAEVVETLIQMAKAESPNPTPSASQAVLQPVGYNGWNQANSDQHWALDQLAIAGERALPAIPTLVKLLQAANSQTRQRAARTIGEIGPKAKAALPALQRASKLEQLIFGVNQAVLKDAIAKVEGKQVATPKPNLQ